MSVLAKDRKEAKYEFYRNAVKLQRAMLLLVRRHFGLKTRSRTFDVKALSEKMPETDKAMFEQVCKQNGITGLEGEYDLWLLEMIRELIFKDAGEMLRNITDAFTIYPTNLSEYFRKREHQNEALCCCERLIQDLEMAVDTLPIKASKVLPYVEQIDKEVRLLKGWRKSDNKLRRQLELKHHITGIGAS